MALRSPRLSLQSFVADLFPTLYTQGKQRNITTICNIRLPSSGSSLWLKLHNTDRWSSGYDISYTSSDTRGCGGELYGTRGAVTSQNFPNTYNQTSDCYWTVRVPQGQRVKLKFTAFMVGPEEGACTENYVELVDGIINPNVRRLIPRFGSNVKWVLVDSCCLGSVAILSPPCIHLVPML